MTNNQWSFEEGSVDARLTYYSWRAHRETRNCLSSTCVADCWHEPTWVPTPFAARIRRWSSKVNSESLDRGEVMTMTLDGNLDNGLYSARRVCFMWVARSAGVAQCSRVP